MGLFSKKKKPSAAEVAAQEAAARKAQTDAAARAAAAAEASKREAEKRKDEKILTDITAKRKDIQRLEGAVNGFAEERRKEAMLAKRAREQNRMTEAKAHLRAATRLKARMDQYERQLVQNQTQLDALEDAAFQRQGVENIKKFTDNMSDMKQDTDEVETALQDMREAMAGVNDVNLTLQADSELNKSAYDVDDAMAELDALEAEYAGDAATTIPAVPGEVPAMPAAVPSAVSAADAAAEKEEEEIRRLEADIGLL